MVTVDVLIPVLGRPARAKPVYDSLVASVSEADADVRPLFLCSPGDDDEIATLVEQGLPFKVVAWPPGPGDWARKINWALTITDGKWVFTGADDLYFHPGWLQACLAVHAQTEAKVIGTNDMGNPSVISGLYATHLLVEREYALTAVADEPGHLLCEKYDHNCPDTELVETARYRRTYAPARDAFVEHLHPAWRKGTDDATYRKGKLNHGDDRRLFMRRRHLWMGRVIAAENMRQAREQRLARMQGGPRRVARWPQR